MTATLRTEVIGVRGMHCGGCERTVSQALAALPGVAAARADFVAEEVEVTFEPDRVGTGRDPLRRARRGLLKSLKPDDPRTGRRRRQVAAKCGHVRSQRPMTILDRNCLQTVSRMLAIRKHVEVDRNW